MGGSLDVSSDESLRAICERAGLSWRACQQALHDRSLRARVEENTAALIDLGHWGVPVLAFEGELFWGQDRIEDLEIALGDAGLEHLPAA